MANNNAKAFSIYSEIAINTELDKAKEEIQKPEPASKLKDDKNAANSKEKGGK